MVYVGVPVGNEGGCYIVTSVISSYFEFIFKFELLLELNGRILLSSFNNTVIENDNKICVSTINGID